VEHKVTSKNNSEALYGLPILSGRTHPISGIAAGHKLPHRGLISLRLRLGSCVDSRVHSYLRIPSRQIPHRFGPESCSVYRFDWVLESHW
jgi:hypothetical protein